MVLTFRYKVVAFCRGRRYVVCSKKLRSLLRHSWACMKLGEGAGGVQETRRFSGCDAESGSEGGVVGASENETPDGGGCQVVIVIIVVVVPSLLPLRPVAGSAGSAVD